MSMDMHAQRSASVRPNATCRGFRPGVQTIKNDGAVSCIAEHSNYRFRVPVTSASPAHTLHRCCLLPAHQANPVRKQQKGAAGCPGQASGLQRRGTLATPGAQGVPSQTSLQHLRSLQCNDLCVPRAATFGASRFVGNCHTRCPSCPVPTFATRTASQCVSIPNS